MTGASTADELAYGLGYEIEECSYLREGVLGQADTIGQRILVRPGLQSERRAFTIAHEVSELMEPVWLQLELRLEQRFHDAVASELLVPEGLFIEAVEKVGVDMPALKHIFPGASTEVILRRFSDLAKNAVTSKWVAFSVRWREAYQKVTKKVIRLEEDVAAMCLRRSVVRVETKWANAFAWRMNDADNRTTPVTPHRALVLVVLKEK